MIMVTWEWKSVKQGGRDRRARQGGNRDEWRGVRDKLEIRWRWVRGDWRCNREGGRVEWSCWRSIGNPVSNIWYYSQ